MTKEEWIAQERPRVIARVCKILDLERRVPEALVKNGLPNHPELVSVCAGAVACCKLGANFTWFRRPDAADLLKGLWPAEKLAATAKQIMDTFELDDLLQPA